MSNLKQLVKKSSSVKRDLKLAIKSNANMLDALYRLTFQDLEKDDYAFLESQLRKTPGCVIVFLNRLSAYGKPRLPMDDKTRMERVPEDNKEFKEKRS